MNCTDCQVGQGRACKCRQPAEFNWPVLTVMLALAAFWLIVWWAV